MGQRKHHKGNQKIVEINENYVPYTKMYGMHQLKAVFRGKCITVKHILKRQKKVIICLSTLRNQKKEEQTKPKTSRRKKIINLGGQLNEIDNRKNILENQRI